MSATKGTRPPLTDRELADQFEQLIAAKRLFGAERNPVVVKKIGKGPAVLVRNPPPIRRMVPLWRDLLEDRISPFELLKTLAEEVKGATQTAGILLFGRERIYYDTSILRGGKSFGYLLLALHRERERIVRYLPFPTKPGHRVVHIEEINLSEQSTGYATALFLRYESLFRDLGFHLFRLKASLSVGKYYWAKTGYECIDPERFLAKRERLRTFIHRHRLPVEEREIDRLTRISELPDFRRDLEVPVWRRADGYYAAVCDDAFTEECRFPVGKAFLLCDDPWDGYKVIGPDSPPAVAP